MLSYVKIPFNELMDQVLALDNSIVDADQLDKIIQFCPTKEEMDQLKDYKGGKDELGKCEQFFLELMKVPRAEYKLIAFSYMLRFKSRVSELRQCLNICQSAMEQWFTSSSDIHLGSMARARNSRLTLMHYLCKVLADKLAEVLDFSKDLGSLEPASKMQLKLLAEKIQVITRGLSTVIGEKRFAKKEGRVSKKFRQGLKEFLCSARNEVYSLVYIPLWLKMRII
nr:hypothetical protein [Tanacetum cinerariifolium]